MNKSPMAAKQIGKVDVLFIFPPHFNSYFKNNQMKEIK